MPTLALMLSDVSAALFGTLLGGPIVSLLPVEPFVYPLPKFFRCSLKNYNIDMRWRISEADQNPVPSMGQNQHNVGPENSYAKI